MADVIAEAGVTQGALYFHFPSKKVLAEEVIRRQHELSISAGERRLQSAQSSIDGLVLLSGDLARLILDNDVARAGLRLSTESSEFFPDVVTPPYRDWIDAAEEFLTRGCDEGDIRRDIDISAASFVPMATFTGVHVVAQATHDDLIVRLEHMWKTLLPAVMTPERADDASRAIALLRA